MDVGDILLALGKFCGLLMVIGNGWWDYKNKRKRGSAHRSSLYAGFTGFGGCGGFGGGCS